MDIIDDQGRLFGVANIIDVLVLLLVLAVVAAGVALVAGGNSTSDGGPQETRYATVSYTVPLESQGATLETGDSLSVIRGGEVYNVSDVYRSFTPEGAAHIVARIEYSGDLTTNGNRLYGGDEAELTTGSYRMAATVLANNQTRSTLSTRQVPVVLALNSSSSTARAIEVGQRATIANQTVATVASVGRESNATGHQRVFVGVELEAWERHSSLTFDGERLLVDNPVTIITDTAVIRGRVHEVGTTTIPEN